MYNAQPPHLGVVTAPPSKDLPSNLPTSPMPPKEDPGASYKLESVSKKASRSNEAKGTMYALLSETTMASRKTSYSEKVAVVTKEATFAKEADDEDEENDKGKSYLLSNEPSSTAVVSVDDEDDNAEDDVVQGEVVSSQIITSRY